jgi:hypothetical protein
MSDTRMYLGSGGLLPAFLGGAAGTAVSDSRVHPKIVRASGRAAFLDPPGSSPEPVTGRPSGSPRTGVWCTRATPAFEREPASSRPPDVRPWTRVRAAGRAGCLNRPGSSPEPVTGGAPGDRPGCPSLFGIAHSATGLNALDYPFGAKTAASVSLRNMRAPTCSSSSKTLTATRSSLLVCARGASAR